MSQIINTNIASSNVQRNLAASKAGLSTSLQRLSSGLRINSARDDAAGLAISERFTSQIRGLNQAVRNANDGISLSQVAEGALSEVSNNLQRIRELAIQSANASNSTFDRQQLQQEVAQLISEIDRVATATNFNDVRLLDGSFSTQLFQVGDKAGDTIAIANIKSARASDLGQFQGFQQVNLALGAAAAGPTSVTVGSADPIALGTIDNDALAIANALNSTGAGFFASANSNQFAGTTTAAGTDNATFTLNGISINLNSQGSAGANRAAAVSAINAQSAATGVVASDNGSALTLTAADGRNIEVTNPAEVAQFGLEAGISRATLNVSFTAQIGQSGNVVFAGGDGDLANPFAIGASGTAVSALDISTVAGANQAIRSMDAAIATVVGARAELGAVQNRFEATVRNLQTTVENLDASRSRVRDADFAQETAALTRSQILQQAGIAVLAQANAQPQSVLALLQ